MKSAETTAQVPEDMTGRPRRVTVGEISWRQTFRAMRHRNFRLFIYGQLTSLIGTWMQQTALGWLVYQLTNSKFLLGAIAAAGSAPMLVFSMWGGSLADRHPKRAILVATQSGEMIFAFALALIVWLGQSNHGARIDPWLLIFITTLNGIAMGFDMPARQAFTLEMTSREDLMNAVSLNSSVVNGARIVGPALAGFVMAHAGAAACFFLNGVSFLAVIAGLLMMRLPPHVKPVHAASTRAHALGGLRYVWNHARVLTILSLFAVVGIFGWSYSVVMPAFARDVLGLSENGFGILLASSGVGALVGALTIATAGHVFPPRIVALSGVWIFSAMLFLFSINRNFYLALPCLALAGFGMMLFFSTSNTVVQTIVPDEMRGRVMGVWALIFGGMIPVGSIEAGTLANWVGTPAAIGFGAIICALAAVVTLFVARRRDAKTAAAAKSNDEEARAFPKLKMSNAIPKQA